jgi:CHAT domain-containing protein
MNLDGTALVVLSACESALGEVQSGEGVYGLRRAFQTAGARTVVSALWPVSDQTTIEIVQSLYQPSDQGIAVTLQQAQIDRIKELRRSHQSDHPISWGAFVAAGDWH